jgi:hypothetical protein
MLLLIPKNPEEKSIAEIHSDAHHFAKRVRNPVVFEFSPIIICSLHEVLLIRTIWFVSLFSWQMISNNATMTISTL